MRPESWTIFGAGELIADIIDAIESMGQQVDSLVLNMELERAVLDKVPGSIRVVSLDDFRPASDHYFIGFLDPDKGSLLRSLKKHKLTYANVVHRFSYVPGSVKMGQGNLIGAGAVLASNVRLGDFNFVNRAASIGHDTRILHFNHVGPGCTIAGNCVVGSRNRFYTRSAVVNKLRIKDDITVGAGAVVVEDLLAPGTYSGLPAKRRNRER